MSSRQLPFCHFFKSQASLILVAGPDIFSKEKMEFVCPEPWKDGINKVPSLAKCRVFSHEVFFKFKVLLMLRTYIIQVT